MSILICRRELGEGGGGDVDRDGTLVGKKDKEKRHRHRSEKDKDGKRHRHGHSSSVENGNGSSSHHHSNSDATATTFGGGESVASGPPGSANGHQVLASGAPTDFGPYRDLQGEEGEETIRSNGHRSKHHKTHGHHQHKPPARPRTPKPYPLDEHLCNPSLFLPLLPHLSFRDFYSLLHTSKLVGKIIEGTKDLREIVLERYLGGSVGYKRWRFDERREPVTMSLTVSTRMDFSLPSWIQENDR